MTLNATMNAMVLENPGQPLVYQKVPMPVAVKGQLLIKVIVCGICRTDLHILDGELSSPKLPLIMGHELIGRVVDGHEDTTSFKINDLVGVPWLGYACGTCKYCRQGKENLCDKARFTGYTVDGGYAEYAVAETKFCIPLEATYSNAAAAPLLCAGLIGFRSYRMIDPAATNIGLYGFGAAAHILTQIATNQGRNIFAFTREGDSAAQLFGLKMGACWAGSSTESPPEKLDAAIIFAPAGELIPIALKAVDKAGSVICGGIHMSQIPAFSYELLWEERTIRSVANMTRHDGHEFFRVLKDLPVHTQTQSFDLRQANEALDKLRLGKITGAAVLVIAKS